LLVLPGSELAEAVAFADQLCAVVAEEDFGGIRVTLSCNKTKGRRGTTVRTTGSRCPRRRPDPGRRRRSVAAGCAHRSGGSG